MALEFTASCLRDSVSLFHYYKKLGDGAMAQLDEAQLLAAIDPEMNSIAQIVKHMAGNMRSRWAGFPDADGESPTRNRDSEFIAPPATRADVLRVWEEGWGHVFAAVDKLSDADMDRTTLIRGEAHSITQAIHRQVAHYAYHVGQIVFWAKHLRSENWQSLSVPRNRSAEFNQKVSRGEASQR
ncbi:MAG TPA: DUF1572 family protein [Terriglobales bacterium]|jgi:hypothetical protein